MEILILLELFPITVVQSLTQRLFIDPGTEQWPAVDIPSYSGLAGPEHSEYKGISVSSGVPRFRPMFDHNYFSHG